MMTQLEKLVRPSSSDGYILKYTHAKATCTCIRCEKPAYLFRNTGSIMEYNISALCQNCQDEFLDMKKLREGKNNYLGTNTHIL